MFSRVIRSGNRCVRFNLAPKAGTTLSSSWRRDAVRMANALPQSHSFSSALMQNTFHQKQEQEQTIFTQQQRAMSTVTPIREADDDSAATLEDSKAESVTDVVRQYGLYPLAGLVTFAAISKEVYILEPETLFLGNFVLSAMGIYLMSADAINDFCKAEQKKEDENIKDMFHLQTTFWKVQQEKVKSRMAFGDYLSKVSEQDELLAANQQKADTMAMRNAFYDSAVKKLKNMEASQIAEANSLRSELLSLAHQETVNIFSSNKTFQKKFLDQSIDLYINGKTGEDVLKQVFSKGIESAGKKMTA